ncbi:MAG: hypothetical protein PHY16_18245 [Methylobacter sp.]|nr:hypothetical protein [Methylobacter sp.]
MNNEQLKLLNSVISSLILKELETKSITKLKLAELMGITQEKLPRFTEQQIACTFALILQAIGEEAKAHANELELVLTHRAASHR